MNSKNLSLVCAIKSDQVHARLKKAINFDNILEQRVTTQKSLVDYVTIKHPDIVLIHTGFSDDSFGLRDITQLNSLGSPLISIGTFNHSLLEIFCLKAGAKGYFPPDFEKYPIEDSLNLVSKGQYCVSDSVFNHLVFGMNGNRPNAHPLENLSVLQFVAFMQFGQGTNFKEVLYDLNLTQSQGYALRKQVCKKLGISFKELPSFYYSTFNQI